MYNQDITFVLPLIIRVITKRIDIPFNKDLHYREESLFVVNGRIYKLTESSLRPELWQKENSVSDRKNRPFFDQTKIVQFIFLETMDAWSIKILRDVT